LTLTSLPVAHHPFQTDRAGGCRPSPLLPKKKCRRSYEGSSHRRSGKILLDQLGSPIHSLHRLPCLFGDCGTGRSTSSDIELVTTFSGELTRPGGSSARFLALERFSPESRGIDLHVTRAGVNPRTFPQVIAPDPSRKKRLVSYSGFS
jgi:hypothetical protein